MQRREQKVVPCEVGQLICGLNQAGCVVSIFDKAVNIRISDGLLVSLVLNPGQMTPLSIRCSELFDLLRHNKAKLRVGDSVGIKPGRMLVDNCTIDWTAADRFEGLAEVHMARGLTPSRMEDIRQILRMKGRSGGMLGLIDHALIDNPFARNGALLCEKLLTPQVDQKVKYLSKFIGLGVGFTPSGDDLICGWLLADKLCALSRQTLTRQTDPLEPQRFTADHKMTLLKEASRTNDAGRTLIWMALHGRFPAFLLDAVNGLSKAENKAEMFKVISIAVGHGHSSGTDALVGLLLYYQMYQVYKTVQKGFDPAHGSVVSLGAR